MDKEKTELVRHTLRGLFAKFDKIHYRAGAVSKDGTKALALAYVDARDVMRRLDEVVGPENWSDVYEVVKGANGEVVGVSCILTLCVEGVLIAKMDVGSVSEQPEEGDRLKAAFSDALKRAAVKFGVARYLYDMPIQWRDWDSQRKVFK